MKTKILVVDDEHSITRMIKLNLERTGQYEVVMQNEGSLAIEAAREFLPDLIFLDVMMPDMGGDEIATLLQDDANLRNIKIVFLTAIVTRDETANGRNEIGGFHFIAKPVSTEDLLRTIDKVLNKI